jgi:protein-L-isoaspartate(D-aspartate) O-methyltransferase
MMTLASRRRFFAEEIEVVANVRSRAVVEALASVERERFLPPGPWTILSEADLGVPPRLTADDDPKHVCHNVAVGIDVARRLFNGAPSVVAMAIDALEPQPGQRVLHVGAGTGYFTALLAHCVGPAGRVLAIEVEEPLAAAARANLEVMPWVDVRHGDATQPLDGQFDGILISAGVTHPRETWLDALAPAGRIVLPLTVAMGPGNIGKGLLVLASGTADARVLDARVLTFVAIYSGIGLRDETLGRELAQALGTQPFARLSRLRRDPHERSSACWHRGPGFCFET